jgi:hypothetical protein
MLIIDVIIKIVLNYYIRTREAVISLYNLNVEYLCSTSKNTREYCIEFFFLNINLLADTKEDLNLII